MARSPLPVDEDVDVPTNPAPNPTVTHPNPTPSAVQLWAPQPPQPAVPQWTPQPPQPAVTQWAPQPPQHIYNIPGFPSPSSLFQSSRTSPLGGNARKPPRAPPSGPVPPPSNQDIPVSTVFNGQLLARNGQAKLTACGTCGHIGKNHAGCRPYCPRATGAIGQVGGRNTCINGYPIDAYIGPYPFAPGQACLMAAKPIAVPGSGAYQGPRLVVCNESRIKDKAAYFAHMSTFLQPSFVAQLASHLGMETEAAGRR